MLRSEKQCDDIQSQGTVGANACSFRFDFRGSKEREAHRKATHPGKAGERTSLIGAWKVSKTLSPWSKAHLWSQDFP